MHKAFVCNGNDIGVLLIIDRSLFLGHFAICLPGQVIQFSGFNLTGLVDFQKLRSAKGLPVPYAASLGAIDIITNNGGGNPV